MIRTGLLAAVLVAGCDLQPPPKQGPTPASAPSVPPDADELAACTAIAGHIADVYIAAADQTARISLEHDRPALVQKSADGCNRDHWNDDVKRCYATATDPIGLTNCSKLRAGDGRN